MKILRMSLVDAPLAARGVAQLLVTFGAHFKSLCVALIAADSDSGRVRRRRRPLSPRFADLEAGRRLPWRFSPA